MHVYGTGTESYSTVMLFSTCCQKLGFNDYFFLKGAIATFISGRQKRWKANMLCVCERETETGRGEIGERPRFHTANHTLQCVNALVSNGCGGQRGKKGEQGRAAKRGRGRHTPTPWQ